MRMPWRCVLGGLAILATTVPEADDRVFDIAQAVSGAAEGATVLVPAGTYGVEEAIRLKSGVCLKGAGQDATVLKFVGSAPAVMVDLSGLEDVEICGLTLDGASNPNATQGISASNARRLNIHHATIRNFVKTGTFGPHGVLFSGRNPTREHGVTDSVIADCRMDNIGVGAKYGGGPYPALYPV